VCIIIFVITVHVLCIFFTFSLSVSGTFVCELVIKIILLIIVTYVCLFPAQAENKKEKKHTDRDRQIFYCTKLAYTITITELCYLLDSC